MDDNFHLPRPFVYPQYGDAHCDLDRGKLVTYPGNYDQYLLEKKKPCAWKNYKMPSSIANWPGRGVDPPGDQSTPYP